MNLNSNEVEKYWTENCDNLKMLPRTTRIEIEYERLKVLCKEDKLEKICTRIHVYFYDD